MRINSERLETDSFHRRVSSRITFCQPFSPSEPVGAKSSQIELEIQTQKYTRRDLSVSTTESFVLELVLIGMDRQSPRTRFSHLPRTRPGAEAGRAVPKSILIGEPIPYAERSRAGVRGELLGGTAAPIVLLLRSYLAQESSGISQDPPGIQWNLSESSGIHSPGTSPCPL